MDRVRRDPTGGPSRRRLLQGAALAAVPTALLLPARADATLPKQRRRPADFPDAEWVPASRSNYTVSNRPSTYPVDFVVVHVTQETYDDTLAIFQNPEAQVSAHYVVRSADGHVAQCVRDRDVGWHAGNWDYNTRSIGIEHEGWVDRPEWFTEAMYASSAELTAYLCATYGIAKDREHIIGHNEVPGADHTDPGRHWDWEHYMDLVNAM
ncbi:peptidoglycan recognition family protein [Streptomyces sp. B-S-A8]|uniref:N-acetylmuramoyl-L-alanine amidase n=1 Tax=Streptomyces solicavernae TaxID=3043614 RepID=A0ABT6RU05_9ACTN|nr:peptidoglycan recognition family protein [Streptomyces sp. B-S-A8]MDI3387916.1 peptidoglycan recognition family protein [Streptomyces sp. B-S-A8]